MIEIKPLADIKFDKLFESFSQAFSEYEIQPNKAELAKMIERRGFVAELSFGAFENEHLVSFTLNGIGLFNGIKTAYDTGTGTIKEYRGQGLASRVFTESIPFLIDAGVKQYLLEVLQHNTSAVSVYNKQGFTTTREFNYFVQQMAEIKQKNIAIPNGLTLNRISLSELKNVESFWDYSPSWQNSFEAIKRNPEDFIIIGANKRNNLVGYGIIEPYSGDITQIAVDKKHRNEGIGRTILNELIKLNSHSSIKLINAELNCQSITHLMENTGIPICGKQFEMIKNLI